ncbi:DUF885 family protein [Streptomyces macrosporus]|uniref:DUF885 family protein n=1 Tax=Streptomyces macrosporus TaxID=44032 RepID=UPI003CD079FC
MVNCHWSTDTAAGPRVPHHVPRHESAGVRRVRDRPVPGAPRPGHRLQTGGKVWLEAREAARRRDGAASDLTQFHQHALNLGPMGLDLLRSN